MNKPKIDNNSEHAKWMNNLREASKNMNSLLAFILLEKHISFTAGKQEGFKQLFYKFDKYACIKNDKWYLEFKKEKLK